jgi:hypothetical protein
LWSLLNTTTGIATSAAIHNDLLRDYVVATGTDGYTAVFSAGELSPSFGHQADLIAYADASGPLASTGFARVIAPNDVKQGRYVSNLVALQVGEAPLPAVATAGGPSTQFTVSGAVNASRTFALSDLQSFAAVTQTVTYQTGTSSVTDTFTGVSLWDLLNNATLGVTLNNDPAIKNDVLRKVIVATGSDGYEVVLSGGELSSAFGNDGAFIAFSDSNNTLLNGGSDGFARLVVPGDVKGGRYVSNLVSLTVLEVAAAVPEPGAASLMLIGLCGIAFVRSRTAKV